LNHLITYFVLFNNFYAFRISGIDFLVFGNFFGLILLLRKKIIISKNALFLCFILLINIGYISILLLSTGVSELFIINRLIRTLVGIILLSLIFDNLKLSSKYLIKALFIILLINSVTIILQTVFPSFEQFYGKLIQYPKPLFIYRSIGLIGGYDAAGFVCAIGLSLSYLLIIYQPQNKYYLASFVFFISICLTGRTGMVVGTFITIFFLLFNFKNKPGSISFFKIFFLCSFIILISKSIYELINFSLETDITTIPRILFFDINEFDAAYASQTPKVWSEMWKLPNTFWETLFGTGVNPNIDIGYVNMIHMVGVFGLLLTFLFYAFILRCLHKFFILGSNLDKLSNESFKILTKLFIIIFALLIVYNMKHLYFFSRNFTEIIVIIFLTLNTNYNKLRKRSIAV
jgi:hypothetical protein